MIDGDVSIEYMICYVALDNWLYLFSNRPFLGADH